jgi:hemerythrin
MPIIKWDDSFSVNVVEIDNQHKKLVSMINELNEAMLQAKSKAVMGGIINGLIDYTASHFKTEEVYFEKFMYPYTNSHVKEHQAFVKQVTEFQDQYNKGKIGLSIDVMKFLSDWLKNHIKGSDKKYGPFFNQHGLN